ncbi:TRAP transporter small permease [Hydrogenophaga sp.]|uniref:TRAP transporter small permease n=1 Tax=Hydrogenophaga sp. TaxID=1904254 RepID=UPI0035646AB8
MDKLAQNFYKTLLVLACVSLVAALLSITLNIATRLVDGWTISGLDGYAGYSIAAALFLALPSAFKSGDHIRVTLALQDARPRLKAVLEYWSLGVGLLLSLYLAWFACRLVWLSFSFHDVAATGDATPLWIPQLSMALGCIGFVVAMAHALVARLRGVAFFAPVSPDAARAE